MRYICKACGRKREATYLKVIGQAKNTQNVWLCTDGNNQWSNCNPERHAEVTAMFVKDLDAIEQEQMDKRQRDLDFLKKNGTVKAEVKTEQPKPVQETYMCKCSNRIGGWLWAWGCPECFKEMEAESLKYPKLLWSN